MIEYCTSNEKIGLIFILYSEDSVTTQARENRAASILGVAKDSVSRYQNILDAAYASGHSLMMEDLWYQKIGVFAVKHFAFGPSVWQIVDVCHKAQISWMKSHTGVIIPFSWIEINNDQWFETKAPPDGYMMK